VRKDAEFFAGNNIIDYSLLVGCMSDTDEIMRELEAGERQ